MLVNSTRPLPMLVDSTRPLPMLVDSTRPLPMDEGVQELYGEPTDEPRATLQKVWTRGRR